MPEIFEIVFTCLRLLRLSFSDAIFFIRNTFYILRKIKLSSHAKTQTQGIGSGSSFSEPNV